MCFASGVQRFGILAFGLVLTVLATASANEGKSKATPTQVGDPPSNEALDERIESLAAQKGAEAAAQAIGQAKRARDRARVDAAAGRLAEADRARQIAWAAVLLAERRIAYHHERKARDEAAERASQAVARAKLAREALNAALSRRARAERKEADDATAPEDVAEDLP